MTDHKCTHEIDLAVLAKTTEYLAKTVEKIDKKQDEILSMIGGKHGLISSVEVNKSSIYRLWWWTGGISLAIVGIALAIIKTKVI